jgi:hypothetical protein
LALAVRLAQTKILRVVMVAIQYFQLLHQLVVAEVALVLQIVMVVLEALVVVALVLALILTVQVLLVKAIMEAQPWWEVLMAAVAVAGHRQLVLMPPTLMQVTEARGLWLLTALLMLVVAVVVEAVKALLVVQAVLAVAVMEALHMARLELQILVAVQAVAETH